MPAAPVASRTPATSGMSGKFDGASGETADAMARPPSVHAARPAMSRRAGMTGTICVWLLLRLLGRLRLLRRLVQALDLGVGAQLGHEIDLGLAHRKVLDLVTHG